MSNIEVGWVGLHRFITVDGVPNVTDHGDRDPAYYWDDWAGVPANSWMEVQVWIPGITDRMSAPPDRLLAEAYTNALPNDAPDLDTWGGQALRFVRRDGNNFVYTFDLGRLRWNIYTDPPVPDGLYQYTYRFSTDSGESWYVAVERGQPMRRLALARTLDCSLFPDNAPAGCPQPRPVGWAGNWGGRFNHACEHVDALPDPVTFHKSGLGHDCMVIDAEVYVAGLTDAGQPVNGILAEVETDIGFEGGPLEELVSYPLSFDGRVNNNYRFAWSPTENVGRSDRGDYRYRFRFSADNGATWYVVGPQGDGESFGTLQVRNDSWDIEDEAEDCTDIETWEGPFQVLPACTPYTVAEHHNVQAEGQCVFWVDAVGRGSWSHAQAHARWFESYLAVGAPNGLVRNAGQLTRYREPGSDEVQLRVSLGTEIEPGYYKTGFSWEHNQDPVLAVVDMAFFVDVQPAPGAPVQRWWLSDFGDNYSEAEIFQVPGYSQTIGSGDIEYADGSAPVFYHKWACR